MSSQRYLSRLVTTAQPGRPRHCPPESVARALWGMAAIVGITLAIAALLAAAVQGQQPGAAGDGIRVGHRFTVPMVVGGKNVSGRAIVAADRTLTIVFPSADGLSVDELVYTLTRQDGPAPGPDPQPAPKPDPKPDPAPTPGKLAVIVCLPKTQAELPPEQAGALNAADVIAYLNSHCLRVKMALPDGSQGDTAAWRILSSKADPAGLPENLRAAFTEAKGRPLPTITIFNGKDTYRGDLPRNAADLLAKLRLFGGP